MTIAKLAAIGLFGALQTSPSVVTYLAGVNHFIVSNFDTLNASGDAEKHIHAVGQQVRIDAPEMGIVAKGNLVDMVWAQVDPKVTEIRHGRLEGNATAAMDTEAGYRAALDLAIAQKRKAPVLPPDFSTYKLDSEVMTYEGNANVGAFDFPNPWTLHESGKGITQKTENGHSEQVSFDQVLTADGLKGHIVVGPDETGRLSKIQTGFIIGPAHFKLIRHETVVGTQTTETKVYDGVADRVDIDMTTDPGTIIATGHVVVNSDVDGTLSNFKVDRFVLNVNQQLEPLSIDLGKGVSTATGKDGSG